jgi:hypothetical protein
MQSDRSIVPFILRPLRAHSAPQLAQVPTDMQAAITNEDSTAPNAERDAKDVVLTGNGSPPAVASTTLEPEVDE